MDKVESVQADQSILGRMLDYGTVTILRTGEGFETLPAGDIGAAKDKAHVGRPPQGTTGGIHDRATASVHFARSASSRARPAPIRR